VTSVPASPTEDLSWWPPPLGGIYALVVILAEAGHCVEAKP